jgi:uncharacterized protein
VVYADSSALVKLVMVEPESKALESYVAASPILTTSRLAVVEVSRAIASSHPGPDVLAEADELLSACRLLAVSTDVLHRARRLGPPSLRTLDAIHLASALHVQADELVAYDKQLLGAAAEHDLRTASPGL